MRKATRDELIALKKLIDPEQVISADNYESHPIVNRDNRLAIEAPRFGWGLREAKPASASSIDLNRAEQFQDP